jgi:hypothetical protein
MTYDVSHPVIWKIHREWKNATIAHKSYTIKNKYHQERRMDEWSNVIKNIDADFRGRIENATKDLEREEAERFAMEQEEIGRAHV